MIVVRLKSHETIDLGTSPLFTGGEGKIFAFPNDPTMLAKIFDEPQEGDRLKKVSTLIERPFSPIPPDVGGLAFPEDWLVDSATAEFLGYAMQRVRDAKPILGIWSPQSVDYRPFSVRYRIAANIARLFIEIESHQSNIIFADINSQNLLVDANDAVWLIDLDSCQMTGLNGKLLTSRIHTVDFLSPGLQGKNLSIMPRTRADERFGLAVLLFKLLMDGHHPHNGRPINAKRDVRDLSERIRRGIYPYGNNPGNFLPPVDAPDFGFLPEKIRELFSQCFEEGFNDTSRRPSAQEWFDAFTHGVIAVTKPSQTPNVHFPRIRPTITLPVKLRKRDMWVVTGASAAIVACLIFGLLKNQGTGASNPSDWSYETQIFPDTSNRLPSDKNPKEGLPAPTLVREIRSKMTQTSNPKEGLPAPILVQEIRSQMTQISVRSIEAAAPLPPLVQEVRPRNRLEEQRIFSQSPNKHPQTSPTESTSSKPNEEVGVLGHLRRAFEEMAKDIKDYFSSRKPASPSQGGQS